MLETYAAWLEGTTESDLLAITRAMEGPTAAGVMARKPAVSARPARPAVLSTPPESPRAFSSLSTGGEAKTQVPDNWWEILAEREGFELGGGIQEINNLLISHQLLSPAIPSNPRLWQ